LQLVNDLACGLDLISQVHPQQSITYTNKKPAKALHKKVWGKDEADYIVGTFNGDGMQFYSSWQNRFT
jgi:hypothetical protein